MTKLPEFFRKLSVLFHRNKYSNELAEEMAFHREEAERELRADGMAAEEACYAARRQFGNAVLLKEDSARTFEFSFETMLRDVRYGVRQLRTNAGFAATAIIILALGIGATTAIFSTVNPILFETLPYPNAKRLVMLYERNEGGRQTLPNFADYRGLVERSSSFDAIAALKPWEPAMSGGPEPERLVGQRVSAPFFRALGVQPWIGRDFNDADDQFQGPNVVILSERLWRRRFGADRSILGQQVKLDDETFTVIGVMPAGFENVLSPEAELWAPLQYDPALRRQTREWGHHLRLVARLKSGVGRERAMSEADKIAATIGQIYAGGYNEAGGPPDGFFVNSLQADVTRGVRPALMAVMGAVLLVLVLACVNVTNLLLARGAQRRGEFAMRAALGAARGRLVRQLLTESVLLSLAGGLLGLLIAYIGVRALIALSPPGLPRVAAIHIDAPVFVFALVVTTLVGLAIGLVPALHASRSDPHAALQHGTRTTAASRNWLRRTLVVSEVCLALVLLVSAGLLLRSLQRLFSVDVGFDSSHVLTMQVQEYGKRYRSDAARRAFFEAALERVRAVPGVVSAAFTSQLPLSGDQDVYGVVFESKTRTTGQLSDAPFFRYAVTPGYLETMHIPLLRGRAINEHDSSDVQPFCFNPQICGASPAAVLISQSFARQTFGVQDPLGQRVRMGPGVLDPKTPWATIVGVVGDVKQLSLDAGQENAIYVPEAQWFWGDMEMSLVVRARGDAPALAPAIRKAIWSVDKDQPIVRVATMDEMVKQSEAERRFVMIIFEAFALVALALAATGIYGVLAGSVSERTREIGVRAALGASRSQILGMILRQGMVLTALGMALGIAGAALASRALVTLLFGISRIDVLTYAGVIVMLATVSVIACSVPAWRAARVDPAITLRAE